MTEKLLKYRLFDLVLNLYIIEILFWHHNSFFNIKKHIYRFNCSKEKDSHRTKVLYASLPGSYQQALSFAILKNKAHDQYKNNYKYFTVSPKDP